MMPVRLKGFPAVGLMMLAVSPIGFALASTSAAAVLPPGCNLGIGGQTAGAVVGRPQTFAFDGFNAVPPGHHANDVRIAWGDGAATSGAAATRSRPSSKGCYETVFSGRHTYTHVTCQRGVCSSQYSVRISYEDAQTHAKHVLTMLTVDIVRPTK
jgi:hypothetical protein